MKYRCLGETKLSTVTGITKTCSKLPHLKLSVSLITKLSELSHTDQTLSNLICLIALDWPVIFCEFDNVWCQTQLKSNCGLSLIEFDCIWCKTLYDFSWLDVTHDQGQTISLQWFALVNHISYRRSSMVYTMQSKLMFLTNEETVLQNNYILKRFPICADMKHILWKHFSETVFCFLDTMNTKFASVVHVSCTRKCANIRKTIFP